MLFPSCCCKLVRLDFRVKTMAMDPQPTDPVPCHWIQMFSSCPQLTLSQDRTLTDRLLPRQNQLQVKHGHIVSIHSKKREYGTTFSKATPVLILRRLKAQRNATAQLSPGSTEAKAEADSDFKVYQIKYDLNSTFCNKGAFCLYSHVIRVFYCWC